MPARPTTIDDYLAAVSPARRAPLTKVRRAIRRVLPAAEECISYGMPAFRVSGGIVGGFAPTKDGYSYYPFSGRTLSTLAGELAGYSRTKSALHLSASRPLSASLLRKLLATRMAEIEASRGRRKGTRASVRSKASNGAT
jgi:uncharacterized protein YdhG (YjbR/CyaY superfamily)